MVFESYKVWAIGASALLLATCSESFSLWPSSESQPWIASRYAASNSALFASSLVVVSPPGGVGEVAAVKAATMGASVKWFVVSAPVAEGAVRGQADTVVLSQQALNDVAAAGGKVELAGADASSLLLPRDDPSSAVSAVSAWCGAADSIVCTYDGVESNKKTKREEELERTTAWKNAIKVAAKEAAKGISGKKVAILSSDEAVVTDAKDEKSSGRFERAVGGLFGGGKAEIPSTLSTAMSSNSGSILTLRYGQLFGKPESSPDFSPLIGGPKKFPELCEEYLTRTVRIDSTLSVSGNIMLSGKTTRSSRHSVGEAAALMALGKVPVQSGLDVSLSSQRGSDPVTLSAWQEEFARVQEMLASGKGAQLFSADFGSVPNVARLADWLATKWAPTVLRTYDIAAIRVGARPVYVTQPDDETVEIIWQQLVNFESVIVGKMTIQVSDKGLVALRGPGDASKGFGSISRTPLAGEDVLVRRLSEAAAQAVDKGLANKSVKKTSEEIVPPPVVEQKPVVTSLQSSGSVVVEGAPDSSSATGPRQAGVRRSKERVRGKTRTPKSDESN